MLTMKQHTLVIRKGKFNPLRLYARRMELGLTIPQVAALTARATGTIHGWETAKFDPSPRSLYELSKALQVEPAYFFAQ